MRARRTGVLLLAAVAASSCSSGREHVPGEPPGIPTDRELIPGGVRVSLEEASRLSPFTVLVPSHSAASEADVEEVWFSADDEQVGLVFQSGIVLFLLPSPYEDPRAGFEAEIADGGAEMYLTTVRGHGHRRDAGTGPGQVET